MVHIRVCMADLQKLYTDPTGHMYLIQGTFEDITLYAGTTSPMRRERDTYNQIVT